MDIARKIIDFLMKKSMKSMEQDYRFTKLLKHLGISELKPNFDSVYTHTLVEFSLSTVPGEKGKFFETDSVPVELVQLFAINSVRNAFKKDLCDDDRHVTLTAEINRQLETNKKFAHLKDIFSSAGDFKLELERFCQLFKHFSTLSSTAFELQKYNELNRSMIKMLEILEEQQKKNFDYQVEEEYLKRLRDDFQKEFLDENSYVDLNGETRIKKAKIDSPESEKLDFSTQEKKRRQEYNYNTIPHTPLDIAINEWLRDDSKNLLVIIGEYGTGKTTFCKHMAHQLATNRLEKGNAGAIVDPKNRIPLLFPLRYFEKTIDSFIIYQFSKKGITDIDYQRFLNRLDNGEFILLLDGFDEMTQKIDSEEKSRNFSEIRQLIKRSSKSKILLTTREEYFQSEVEAEDVFKSNENPNYRFVHLRPFNDAQIWQYLNSHTKNPTYYWEQIKGIFDLHDMAKRPVLLELLLECFPRLIEEKGEKESIKSSDLYEACIQNELKRKSNDLTFIIPSKYRLKILQKLAVWIYLRNELAIDVILMIKELNLRQYFKSQTEWDFEKHMNEFLTFTFLIREFDNRFRISHKSFRDYLTAQAFVEEINSGKIENFSRIKTTEEVNLFILEQCLDKDKLLEIVLTSRNLTEEKQWQGTNASTILLKIDNTVLRNRNLSNCHLPYVDFRGCDLTDTNFKYSNLNHCRFDENILSAQIENVNIEHSFWDLSSKGITDVSPLKELKQLTYLDLSHNQIKDITPLKELKQLTYLDLSYNQVTDLTPLGELKNLKNLKLRFNRISTLSPLMKLKQLTHLDLSYNQIEDIYPLRELKLLTQLQLFYNLISNITPLKELKLLTHLYLSGNQIIDITPLKELKQLTQLKLFYNQIKDISPLRELMNLRDLFITGNKIPEAQIVGLRKAFSDLQQSDLNIY